MEFILVEKGRSHEKGKMRFRAGKKLWGRRAPGQKLLGSSPEDQRGDHLLRKGELPQRRRNQKRTKSVQIPWLGSITRVKTDCRDPGGRGG